MAWNNSSDPAAHRELSATAGPRLSNRDRADDETSAGGDGEEPPPTHDLMPVCGGCRTGNAVDRADRR
jgi:hypothetical protein